MTPQLSLLDLTIAGLLLLIDGALSLVLGLKLERALVVAVVRLVVQLSIMGLVLKVLFATMHPGWTALAATVMVLFAGREILARQRRPLSGGWGYGLGTACMLAAAVSVTVFALATSVRPDPWYDPRYALPLLGMVLGNTMTGISLGLDTLGNTLVGERGAVEARLALGGTRWQALGPVARRALTTALMPIINSMAATGLVFLPGMMTGQILAGADPEQAVRYQILIMFLIAGGTALGAGAAVMGGAWRLTDARHRLRLERLGAERRR